MGELSFEGDLDKLMPILEAKFVNLDAGVGSVSEGQSLWTNPDTYNARITVTCTCFG